MKHQLVKAHESIRGEKKSCPRCGVGTFLAKHKDRSYCGKCHYTEFSASK